jgi:hypothetical protein
MAIAVIGNLYTQNYGYGTHYRDIDPKTGIHITTNNMYHRWTNRGGERGLVLGWAPKIFNFALVLPYVFSKIFQNFEGQKKRTNPAAPIPGCPIFGLLPDWLGGGDSSPPFGHV